MNINKPFDLNEKQIQQDLPKYPSDKFADIVIALRYLGLFKQTCVLAMEELANRREKGNDFDYEGYIEMNMKTLPELNPKHGNMVEMLQNLRGMISEFKF